MFTVSIQTDALDKVLDDFVRTTPKFCDKHNINFDEKREEARQVLQRCNYDKWLAFTSIWRAVSRNVKELKGPAELYCHVSCLIGCLEIAYREHEEMKELFDDRS